MPTTIKLKRGTKDSVPKLAEGEPAINTKTGRMYIGAGTENFIYYPSTETPFVILDQDEETSAKKMALNPLFLGEGCPIDLRATSMGDFEDKLGWGAVASGWLTNAPGDGSFACCTETNAPGLYSFAANYRTIASGKASTALGFRSEASGLYSLACGLGTKADTLASTSLGCYNAPSTKGDALVIGNGTNLTSRSNCFRVTFEGKVYGLGAYNTSGADYAEYFEWEDGNPKEEDRVGLFVTLVGDKIRVAGKGDEILGVISATASVIGNSQSEGWSEKYLKDDFGRTLYDIELVEENEVKKPKINPDYNPSLEYEAREDRKEWDPVGLLGRLRVVDDGSCQAGDKCGCGKNGVAVKATDGFKVLKRVSENVIEILMK